MSARRAPRTCCSTTTWARSTAPSARGASRAAAPGHLQRDCRRGASRRRDPIGDRGREDLVRDGPRHGRRPRRTATRSTPTVVASSLDPRLTFLPAARGRSVARRLPRGRRSLQVPRLVGQGEPRARCPSRLHVLPGSGPHLRGAISISPSVDYMERAYDEAKYGRFSRRPYLDVVIPSLTDPSVAPPGKHVMSCFVQYALSPGRRHLGRAARGARRHRYRDARRVRAQHPQHHSAPPGRDAGRSRARVGIVGGQYLPG